MKLQSYAITFFPFSEDKFKATWMIRGCKNRSHALRCFWDRRGKNIDTFIISIKKIQEVKIENV